MTNTKQAKKRVRQSETRRQRNASQLSNFRTLLKKVRLSIAEGKLEAARALFRTTASFLDRAAQRGLLHKNTSARYKSRLHAKIKQLDLNTTQS